MLSVEQSKKHCINHLYCLKLNMDLSCLTTVVLPLN